MIEPDSICAPREEQKRPKRAKIFNSNYNEKHINTFNESELIEKVKKRSLKEQ